jgi:NitT/TauT family transport system ATP-binding protein
MCAIELRAISKSFSAPGGSGDLVIFENLDLLIPEGKTLAVVGPSGCGKTTLLNILASLEPADAGEIIYDGRSPSAESAALRLGYLFQRDALLPWRTALSNALLGLECKGDVSPGMRRRAVEYFERFGLGGFEGAWPHTLSGGQRQRVALIQNILVEPEILLLDEPFGSLDYQTKLLLEEEFLGEIRSTTGRGRRTTVVFVTHDIEEAITLGDRVVVLGSPPQGIVLDVEVNLHETLRSPVAARQSDLMRSLFGEIWAELRASAASAACTRPRLRQEGRQRERAV